MKFYSAKAVCLELRISRSTLDGYVRIGLFPAYEQSPLRKNGVGYFDETFNKAKFIKVPSVKDYVRLRKENDELREIIQQIVTA